MSSSALATVSICVLGASAALAQETAPRAPAWDDFPVFVWRQDRAKEPLEPRFARAFGATNLGRGEDGTPLAQAGLAFYVDNAAGRNDLHLDRDRAYDKRWQAWYDTREDQWLVRQPCLNDPAVRARLSATLEHTLAAKDLGLGVSLGDEVSWTPYGSPEDTCLCAACRAGWRAFLERAAADGRTTLPADFDLARAATDAARAALEHGDPELVHAWLLRRAFTQEVMQRCLRELAEHARKLRPEVPLGLLGMIGRTAFGGVALDRVLPELDFAECYRVGDARELLFTLRRPKQRVIQTIFFDEKDPSAPAWFAWESWMRGADGFVIWSDRELRAHAEYAAALTDAVVELRELRKRAPGFAPRPSGVAVIDDEDSIAYGWLVDAELDGPTWPKRFQGWQEDHGSRERSLRAWLRALEDCGAMPGAVPLSSVGASTVARFPLLVANHLRVLDAAGARRIEEFLGAGGTLAVRGDLGAIDAFGNAPARAWLGAWCEKHAANVIELGSELDAYLEERLSGGKGLRERIAALLARAHAAVAPWRMSSAGDAVPWLSTWSASADGSLTCVSLPNLAEASERQALVVAKDGTKHPRLSPLVAHVEPPDGFEVQWLSPAGAKDRECKLPAGEAAVFRLVHERK